MRLQGGARGLGGALVAVARGEQGLGEGGARVGVHETHLLVRLRPRRVARGEAEQHKGEEQRRRVPLRGQCKKDQEGGAKQCQPSADELRPIGAAGVGAPRNHCSFRESSGRELGWRGTDDERHHGRPASEQGQLETVRRPEPQHACTQRGEAKLLVNAQSSPGLPRRTRCRHVLQLLHAGAMTAGTKRLENVCLHRHSKAVCGGRKPIIGEVRREVLCG
mmetsp:Transcript_8106/g.17777  ORF Transcript_8106/g.17777 Transcript_8106/m.17777 type:complete len:220 (-) Transcript_8106:245-904(-)